MQHHDLVLKSIGLVAGLFMGAGSSIAQPSFTPLGSLPSAAPFSVANAISGDGRFIIGQSSASNVRRVAFRWSVETGFQALGVLEAGPMSESTALGVSGDGGVICGWSTIGSDIYPYIWTASTGMRPLVDRGGPPGTGLLLGVSEDGGSVVGRMNLTPRWEALRWRSTGVTFLGDFPGGIFNSLAQATNGDGSIIVGTGTNAAGNEAFRWTAQTGMISLGDLPGGETSSIATAMSPDGVHVVGYGTNTGGNKAVRWNSGGIIEMLPELPGLPSISRASDVSLDGTIVGFASSSIEEVAVIWLPGRGIQRVSTILAERGVTIPAGWKLMRANAISNDGGIIAGMGENAAGVTEAWRAVLRPGVCDLIAVQPESKYVPLGSVATVSLTPTAAASGYAWSKDGTRLADSVRVAGSATQTVTISGFTATDQGGYRCSVTGTCGTAETQVATLSCKPLIQTMPTGGTFRGGQQVVMNVQLLSGGTTTFRWRKDGALLFNGAVYAGVSTPTLTIQTNDPSQSGRYTLAITNPCGTTTSTDVEITVECPADFNHDGGIDGDDVNAFFADWEAGSGQSDLNDDGGIDFGDVERFFARWEGGC
jgi:uncharacterized membrane protein